MECLVLGLCINFYPHQVRRGFYYIYFVFIIRHFYSLLGR